MKKLQLFSLIISAFVLFSCGGNSIPTAEEESQEKAMTEDAEEMKDMEMIDLSEYDISASLYIPDANKGKPEFHATDWGSLELSVGKKYGIEIVPFGLTLDEKKGELEGDLVYKVEYLKEDPNYFIYKKSIADSDVEAEFHFFMNVELDGDVYEIKNLSDQPYSEKAIEKMIQSAASLAVKSPA